MTSQIYRSSRSDDKSCPSCSAPWSGLPNSIELCPGCGMSRLPPQDVSRERNDKARSTPNENSTGHARDGFIRFACTNCSQKYKASEEHIGRRFRCHGCGQELTVPHEPRQSTGASASSPAQQTASVPEASPSTKGQRPAEQQAPSANECRPKQVDQPTPTRATCPQCKAALIVRRIKEDLQAVRCPGCKVVFRIDHTGAVVDPTRFEVPCPVCKTATYRPPIGGKVGCSKCTCEFEVRGERVIMRGRIVDCPACGQSNSDGMSAVVRCWKCRRVFLLSDLGDGELRDDRHRRIRTDGCWCCYRPGPATQGCSRCGLELCDHHSECPECGSVDLGSAGQGDPAPYREASRTAAHRNRGSRGGRKGPSDRESRRVDQIDA
jgi:hypothetical protein